MWSPSPASRWNLTNIMWCSTSQIASPLTKKPWEYQPKYSQGDSLVAVMSYHYHSFTIHLGAWETIREKTLTKYLFSRHSADQKTIPSRPAGHKEATSSPQRFLRNRNLKLPQHTVHIISDPWATEDNHITTQSMQIHRCRRIRKSKHNRIRPQQSLTTGIACST